MPMPIGETDVSVIFGQRGSGKSTLGRALSQIYPRRIVIDRLREWQGYPTVHTYKAFLQAYAQVQALPEFTLVVQFDVGQDQAFTQETLDQVLRAIYLVEREHRQGLCLVVEEVHFFATPTYSSPWLLEVIFTGRHAGLAVIAGSQRPASVHKGIVSIAANVFMGRLFEPRDIKYLTDSAGEIAKRCPELPLFTFIHYRPGEGSELITP